MIQIVVDEAHTVSALALVPKRPLACFVMAHGAGAGMTHSFMSAMAEALFRVDVATLRFQFPSMEKGSARPDKPALAHATVRAAATAARQLSPRMPLFAGGKSFGGRMTSQAQAEIPLPSVLGLAFLGFPLHPAGRPSTDRADHLGRIRVPMLFLQGTRDTLADMRLMGPCIERLGPATTLSCVSEADHAFHVPVRSGRSDAEVLDAMAATLAGWIDRVLERG
jgi:predicted alpha/beta-hydrolase family hydrolase